MKERVMALVIGIMFLASMGGFALTGGLDLTGSGQEQKVPILAERPLTLDEMRAALQSGAIVVQYHYFGNESDTGAALRQFSREFGGFVIVEMFPAEFQNQTKLQAIGSDGRIKPLEDGLSRDALLDMLCEISFAQPKECLTREYYGAGPTNVTL